VKVRGDQICFILGLTAPLLPTEIVLHPPSGLLYLACSTPEKRRNWSPPLGVLEDDKASFDDYIATYDPATGAVTRLTFLGFPTLQGYSSHGLDVVPSASDPERLFIYAINHRKPVQGPGKLVGADSVVEIFEVRVGGNTLTHVRTVESPIINTPNDIVGASDGRSFYFTNDHGVKVGLVSRVHVFGIVFCISDIYQSFPQSRWLEFLGLVRTSVGYCHVDNGCKIAISGLHGSNGITRAQNGTLYVGNSKLGQIRVFEEQNNQSFVLTDIITLGMSMIMCSEPSVADGIFFEYRSNCRQPLHR
jgi:arylesterase / paraoxonase